MNPIDDKKETVTFRGVSHDEEGKTKSKSGRGGKFTWEGPRGAAEYNELDNDDDVPAAIDQNDPNYVDEEEEKRLLRGEVSGVEGLVVGEVDVAKVVDEGGVARVDVVDPRLLENM
ncbi:hypothetical protein HAX54_007022 [Datura stramonium]|uniref:Uncharacterized protein n=1 Tax=Datura stramonium TaxID=4076 RepID=A0ABS8TB33_DATST|nr:hypothetical protein [Datura stramonium]